METNNIVTAPQIEDTDVTFGIWQRNHTGNYKAFFEFMTKPSQEREEFINSLGNSVVSEFNGSVAAVTIKAVQ